MRAMCCENPCPLNQNSLALVEASMPEPAAHEIRLQIQACGICHTDLHVVEGDLPPQKQPIIPGHQIIGVVEAIGDGVQRFKIGDRAGVPWLNRTCGACVFCQRGKENLCENARFTGYHVDGGFAEYMVVHEDFAYAIPAAFSPDAAAPLLCAGVIGYRALRLSDIQSGQRLGLFGFGASAHLVIQIARHWNCEIFVFSRSAAHRKLAETLGAAWTGSAEETAPAKLDSAIVFAPSGWIVHAALQNLQKGGTVALAGIHLSPIPEMNYGLIYHERTLRSVANSTRDDVRELLQLAVTIPLRSKVEVFPLAEANRALQLLKAGQINGAGVLEIGL
ncbi:MAG: zinc-dependent alcohol dehydrogenase family protein [candidate division KSB1 bacterium]|nr:zinc-dependent alcohol dehydrogenase family protein [candidate division KSB1 bacterium]MDZ7365842.1 zinc-dependent alcohol dehydrogenase family protein [candidate division KSB1 bacterium]MDZ7403923.1 zinc-dependent alcohol dehydrogenase family protein [candidate division KSB1 bacterium]